MSIQQKKKKQKTRATAAKMSFKHRRVEVSMGNDILTMLNNNLIFQLSHRYSLISSCPVAVRVTFSNFIVHWRLNLTAFLIQFSIICIEGLSRWWKCICCAVVSFSRFSILLTHHRRSSEWHVNQQRYYGREELRSSTKFFRLHLHRRARRSSMSFQFRYLKPPSKAAGKVKRLWKKTNDDDFLSLVNRREKHTIYTCSSVRWASFESVN